MDVRAAEVMVSVELSPDEALVLFDWLSTRTDKNDFPFEHPAEQRIIWDLTASLETVLVEPLQPDFSDRLEAARTRVGSQALQYCMISV